MVATAASRPSAAGGLKRFAKKSAVPTASTNMRLRKGANLSRKQILKAQQTKFHEKQDKKLSKIKEAKAKAVERFQKAHNKKAKRSFNHSELQEVHQGLVAAIETLGEAVTPAALCMCCITTINKSRDRKLPYLLAILTACAPKISPSLLQHLTPTVVQLTELTLQEASDQDHLAATKAMKLVQQWYLAMPALSLNVFGLLKKLEPNKLNGVLMPLYVTTQRKILQHAALTNQSSFFLSALPKFVELCLGNFTDAPQDVTTSSTAELMTLFSRTLAPTLVESPQGHRVIDAIVKDSLTQLFKPHTQRFWALAADLVTCVFDRCAFLKRTDNSRRMLTLFPSASFLLKVLNKIRQVEDTMLNSHVEKAMIAIGNGMMVEQFVEILRFDPRDIVAVRNRGGDDDEVFKMSYLVNIVRRIAAHDSFPFFVSYFMPIIQFCGEMAAECNTAQRMPEMSQWQALVLQYWRVCVGFCHYPRVLTNESFRDVAKQLVGLLTTPLADTAATALHVLCGGYNKLAQLDQNDDELFGSDSDDEEEAGPAVAGRPPARRREKRLEDNELYLRMTDESWNPHAYHGITQQQAQAICQTIFPKYSSNIMPRLCNVFETHDSTAILDAIQSYSKVCSAAVMQTILKGVLDLAGNIAAGAEDSLTSESSHKISSKRRMILDIACAIVPQLENAHVATLFDSIVEPVLSDPSPLSRILQKKAYKLLYAMFEHRIKDMMPLFSRVLGLLAVGQQHITVSALKLRIRCLNWALDACKMFAPETLVSAIDASVGEVVLFARERSSGARDMAMDVLEKMQRYMTAAGCATNTLLHKVLAGLSGKTGLMLSCTVVSLAKLVYITHDVLSHSDLIGTTSCCFRMMESSIPEVRTAAATYARMVLKLGKRSVPVANAVREALPKLLMAIALVTSQSMVSSSVRVTMRVLLEKCIKRFGFESVDSLFPLGSKRFLQYTNKMLRREEKKAEREQKKKDEASKNEFNDLFLGTMKMGGQADEEPADLLEGGALQSFVAHRSALPFQGQGWKDDGKDDEDDFCIDTTGEGKLRIVSKLDKAREDEVAKRKAMAARLLGKSQTTAEAIAGLRSEVGGRDRKKRGREDDEAEDHQNKELVLRYGNTREAEVADSAAASFGRGRGSGQQPSSVTMKLRDQRDTARELKRARMEEDIKTGEEYTTGKGSGDVKRGQVDPFAYVPLNRKFMNKRHLRHAVQRFEAVSHKALKGNKAKTMNERGKH